MTSSRVGAPAAAFLAFVATCIPRDAGAVERQHHLGAGVGPTLMTTGGEGGRSTPGISLGLHYTYGLTDAFNLVVEGAASLYFAPGDAASANPKTLGRTPRALGGLGAGVVYVLDVLQWVPYAGVLLGGAGLSGGLLDGALFLPDAQAALGLDYQFSHSVTAGVAYRQHFLFTKLDAYPSYASVFARIEYAWGF